MKALLTLALGLFFASLFGQAEKGDWMIGGNARFWQHANAGGSGESLYQVAGDVNGGYFWHRSFISGLRLGTLWTYSTPEYFGSVYTRYYFHTKTVSPFAELNVGYGVRYSYNVTIDRELTSIEEYPFWGARIGGAFWITPKVSCDVYFFSDHKDVTIHYKRGSLAGTSGGWNERINGLGVGFQILL